MVVSERLRQFVIWGMIFLGAWLRFTQLDWGYPFHFHPDERNVASAVTRLEWGTNMNPDFFAYGSFPIYVIYALSQLFLRAGWLSDPFAAAVMASRFLSASFSVLLIPLTFWTVKRYFHDSVALLAMLLTTFCVGFIQFAHYGTFEMWLTIETFLLLICTIELSKKLELVWVLLAGVFFGLSVGTKVTSLIMAPGIALGFLLYVFAVQGRLRWVRWGESIVKGLLLLLVAFLMFANTNPYAFNQTQITRYLDDEPLIDTSWKGWLNPDFVHSINVEGQIARGELDVFYTRQFVDTIPGIFQLIKVYPWILSSGVMVVGLLGLLLMGWRGIRRKHAISLLIVVWWVLQVVFLGTLYVKWTRYLIPTLPYLLLAGSWVIMLGFSHVRTVRVMTVLIWAIVGIHTCWAVAYGLTYFKDDTRLQLENWAVENLDPQTKILSEVYDLGIIPLNSHFRDIELFNFYELDHPTLGAERESELIASFNEADVFIVLSRRIWKNSTEHRHVYPRAAYFYDMLLSGSTDFVKVAEFSNYPSLGSWVVNDELGAEETFSVFERPRIQVWRNVQSNNVVYE